MEMVLGLLVILCPLLLQVKGQDCGTPAAPANGTVSAPTTTLGSTAEYTCITGFNLTGDVTRTCRDDGNWNGSAPTCVVIDCGPVPSRSGYVLLATTPTTHNSRINFTCDTGYTGPPARVWCYNDGKWWLETTGCTIEDCGSPESPTDGTVSVNKTTYGSEANYTCNTGYNISGDATRTCEAGRTWNGSVPTCNPFDCGPPSQPGYHFVVTSTGTTYSNIAYTYTCAEGYTGQPTNNEVTCGANGTWSSTQGCNIVDCGALSSPANSTVSSPSTTYGSEATYSCNTGYNMNGAATRTCQAGGSWNGSVPTCVIVDCRVPASPAGGNVSGPSTTYGSEASYSCNTGYNMNGAATRTCEADGNWNGSLPICDIDNCGIPASPADGSVSGPSSTYGSEVSYSCNTGYNLNGTATRTCEVGGNWNGSVPTCDIVDCGVPSSSADGNVFAPSTTYGSEASYSCNTGYNMNGAATRTCEADGNWNGSVPTCDIDDCGVPSSPADGNVTAPSTTYGSEASYSCNTGYNMNGAATRTCDAAGNWNGSVPTCDIVDCGVPASPADGNVSSPNTTYGSEASYSCNTGYDMNGAAARTCEAGGNWSSSVPTCDIVNCGYPISMADGHVSAQATTYGSVASYSCNTGYNMNGTATRTCEAEAGGTWNGSVPTCNIVDCGTPESPTDGTVSAPSTIYGSEASYSCNTGYNMNGAARRTCEAGGTWNGSVPTCDIADCGIPESPTDGNVSAPITTYGSEASYSCNTGYNMNGAATRTCEAGGNWNGSATTCVIVDCDIPASPADGNVSAPYTTYGSEVSYSCNTGYDMNGAARRTCEAGGNWNGSVPSCDIVDCGAPSTSDGYTLGNVGGTTFGQTVSFSCATGYNGDGGEIQCQADHRWSPVSGCAIVNCGHPSATEEYRIGTIGLTTFGETVFFTCATGYTGDWGSISCESSGSWSSPSGCARVDCDIPSTAGYILDTYTLTTYQSTIKVLGCETDFGYTGTVNTTSIECLSTGSWSAPQGCALWDCGEPEQPTNGNVSYTGGTKYDAIATQSCNIGFEISGSLTIKCLDSGVWSAGPVTCTLIYCSTPVPPLYGSVSAPTRDYGSVATFSCDTGFSLVGDEAKECLLSGLWSGDDNPTCSINGNCGTPPSITYTSVSLNAAGTVATYACVDGYDFANANNQQLTCGSNNQWTGARPQCRIRTNRSGLPISLRIVGVTIIGLDNPAIWAVKRDQYEFQLTQMFRARTGRDTVLFVLTGLRSGSLVIDGDIVIPNESASIADYLRASSTLVFNEEPIILDGQEGTFNTITVANETFTKTDTAGYICKAYDILKGPCQSGYECVATSTADTGSAECRPIAEEDNLAVIIGVGAGVPLSLLLLTVIVSAVIYLGKRRHRHSKYESESESDNQSRFRPTVTRYPGRYPPKNGIDGPSHYEMDSSAYSISRYFNYPRDNMYHYYSPGRKMHIERPKY